MLDLMNIEMRKEMLNNIIADEKNIVKTGVELKYRGKFRNFNTYRIPLECLIYNQYNGRIGSAVMSFEKQSHILNPENVADVKVIEDFLWDSREDRNEATMNDLVKEHQREYGIVTNSGKIVDGNRRAMLLNKIYRARDEWATKHHADVDHCKYFEAIILPDEISKNEILELETRIQLGQDEKVEYNAIEKYLKCKQLQENHFEIKYIAEMMSEKEGDIQKYLRILSLMEEYLKEMQYEGIYTRLEGREDHFIKLLGFLEIAKQGKAKKVQWNYQEMDLIELKAICFDYIRAQYEGKEFRNIFDKIFLFEDSWTTFKDLHYKKLKEHTGEYKEPSVEELREKDTEGDLSKILRSRDDNWSEEIMPKLKNNLGYTNSMVEAIISKGQPLENLKKAFNFIEKIDLDSIDEEDEDFEEIVEILGNISKKSYELKKELQ